MDVRSLIRFSFDLFDADLSGYLDVAEVFELLAEVYGEDYEHNYRLKKLIKELDENGDEKISFEEFRVINERYPSMLFPAFRMQKALRDNVLGELFWQEQLKQRIKMGYGASPTIWEILEAVDLARKAIQDENMRRLEEDQYKNPLDADDEGPSTYVARPSLSDAGKRDPKIAQSELLERAERGWRERDERQKRRARNHAAFEAAVSIADAAKRPERVHPAVEHGGLAEAAGALDTRSERLQNRIGRAVAMQDSAAPPAE
jgi:EF-hand domain pair